MACKSRRALPYNKDELLDPELLRRVEHALLSISMPHWDVESTSHSHVVGSKVLGCVEGMLLGNKKSKCLQEIA